MDLGTNNLRFERSGAVAWCIVDNPAARNALSTAMYKGLGLAIKAVAADPSLRVLIYTGVDDVFIVGGDVASHETETPMTDDDLPFQSLYRGDVPVVAAINGHCQASGVWLAVLADVAIASDRARFRLPEVRLGVPAPWSSAILPGVVGLARAKDLALTGRSFGAAEALAMGLIARVVPHEQLNDEATRVAADLMEAAPQARADWKRAAHHFVRQVSEHEVEQSITTAEAKEGFAAFAERRPPVWSPRASMPADTKKRSKEQT